MVKQRERESPPSEAIRDARHDERAARSVLEPADLGGGEPQHPPDLGVERPADLLAPDLAHEREAEERRVARRVPPAIDTEQMRRPEAVRGFLQRLALAG